MATIPLRDGTGAVVTQATVDDEDYERLGGFVWSLRSGYARRTVETARRDGRRARRVVYLHREVVGATTGDLLRVSHRDGNRLDNRRANLQVTPATSGPTSARASAPVWRPWQPDTTENRGDTPGKAATGGRKSCALPAREEV